MEKHAGKKKKWIIPLVIVIVLALIMGLVLYIKSRGGAGISDDTYIDDGTYADVGGNQYFNGIIEPQKTWDIQADGERTVKEIYVNVGDSVTTGQKLFAYDTADMSIQLQQAQIELEGINNDITAADGQIKELQDQKKTAPADQQLEYTTQIQQAQNSQKQAQLSAKQKQAEIDNLKKSLDNAIVTSTMDGVVKQINANSNDTSNAFMTILATGAYQVKGSVDEMNVGTLSEGMKVIVHSRVDETKTWEGTISKIDTEDTVKDQNNNMYGDMGSSDMQATKYHFYVALDTADDLLLGQHVYVEPVFEDIGMEDLTFSDEDGDGLDDMTGLSQDEFDQMMADSQSEDEGAEDEESEDARASDKNSGDESSDESSK